MEGDGALVAFETAYRYLRMRVEQLVALDLKGMSDDEARAALQDIYVTAPGAEG